MKMKLTFHVCNGYIQNEVFRFTLFFDQRSKRQIRPPVHYRSDVNKPFSD